MPNEPPPDILRVEDLKVSFSLHNRLVEVVKGVSFRVPAGKTVALVGESGSGKTVISQSVMGLLPKAGVITGGRILFNDPAKPGEPAVDVATYDRDGRDMRHLRGGRIGMIFQEPMSSLSPIHTIGNQIEEALRLHQPVAHGARVARPSTCSISSASRTPSGPTANIPSSCRGACGNAPCWPWRSSAAPPC